MQLCFFVIHYSSECHYFDILASFVFYLIIFAKNNLYMKTYNSLFLLLVSVMLLSCSTHRKVYKASDFGIYPNTGEDMTKAVADAVAAINGERGGRPATLLFESGEYDFYP